MPSNEGLTRVRGTLAAHRYALLSGDVPLRKFGYNADVDASGGTPEDIIAAGGSQYWPSAAVAAADIDIVSDDAEVGGATGITIQGLDANYMLQSEVVTLNGLTDVHPVNDYLRIHRAFVSAGVANIGTIQIDDGAGNVLAVIPAGAGQTQQAAYTVPANYISASLVQFNVTLANKAAATVQGYLYTREVGGAWLVKEIFSVANTSPLVYPYALEQEINPKTDIRLTIFDASGLNMPVAGGFEMILKSE